MATPHLIRYKSSFGFIDLLFNLLVGVTLMFFLAFLLINPVAKKKDIDATAEYFVILSWQEKSANDVDLWVMDDKRHIVSFRSRDHGLMHLDRDDLGQRNDSYIDKDTGRVIRIYENREVVSIRGKDPRIYTASVHLYALSGIYMERSESEDVSIELIQVNPYKVLETKKLTLTGRGDEQHVFAFEVRDDGNTIVTETGELIVNNEDIISDHPDHHSHLVPDGPPHRYNYEPGGAGG